MSNVVTLVVDAAGNLVPPDPARVPPNSTVVFVLINDHATDDFRVEFNNFKIKETMAAQQILHSAGHFRRLSPGEVNCVKEKTKNNFGSGVGMLPFTTYKYDVTVTNLTAGTAAVVLDPDFDIPPP